MDNAFSISLGYRVISLRIIGRFHTKTELSLTASVLTKYDAGCDKRAVPPNTSPRVSQKRMIFWPSRVTKKYLARPWVRRNKRSAESSWFTMTELEKNLRSDAAAKTVFASALDNPSRN